MGNLCISDENTSPYFTCRKCNDPHAKHGRSKGCSDRTSCRFHAFSTHTCDDCGTSYGKRHNCYHRQ